MSDTTTERAINREAMKVSDEVAISITDMNKWYGTFHVLRDINLTVNRGERIVVSITMILLGLTACLASLLAWNFSVLLWLIFLMGVCYSSVQSGGAKAVVAWVPKESRGFAAGLRQAAVPLGTALAAIVLPWIALQHSWNAAVFLQGVVAVFGGLLFLFL